MNQKNLNKRLGIFCLISALIFFVALIFSRPSAPKPILSAILNPANAQKIDTITIFENDKQTKLERTQNGWFALQENPQISVRAEPSFVEQFVKKMAQIRPLYKISDSADDWNSLFLHEKNAVRLELCGNGEVFTRAYFGITDDLSHSRAFRAESAVSYETADDFSQFLTTDLDYWAAGEFFCEIKEDSVQTILFSDFERDFSFKKNADEENFNQIAHSILSLRHGAVRPDSFFEKSKKIANLEVRLGDGSFIFLDFFEDEKKSFFIKKTEIPQTKENCVYEISDWTKEKIFSIFY